MDHIRELRTRIIVCAVVLIISGIIGYIFYSPILEWLRSPLGTNLYYSTPAGSFNFVIKVVSMVGILAAVPFVIFQLIMFVQPVFKERLSTARVMTYTILSILLAVTGALFAFYVILPGALKFFAGFQIAGLSALIDANNYLNFVTNAMVTFIVVFQIPLLMVIIDHIKPISPSKLLKAEKWVVLGGLLVSLLVPFALDVTTSLLIASPIIILYNVSVAIIMIRHAVAHHKKAERPVTVPLGKEEIMLNNHFISDFVETPMFAHVAASEATASSHINSTPIHIVKGQRTGIPLHAKPLPGAVNIERLRAEAKAQREQKIAERVARYNHPTSFRLINDIR